MTLTGRLLRRQLRLRRALLAPNNALGGAPTYDINCAYCAYTHNKQQKQQQQQQHTCMQVVLR